MLPTFAGMARKDVDLFVNRLDKTLKKFFRKHSSKDQPEGDHLLHVETNKELEGEKKEEELDGETELEEGEEEVLGKEEIEDEVKKEKEVEEERDVQDGEGRGCLEEY